MSQYGEVIQVVEELANDSKQKSFELLQYVESLGGFVKVFSRLVSGTNDTGTKLVYSSFIAAQKDLYKAAKALLEASKTGYEFCEEDSPKILQLKKVRR